VAPEIYEVSSVVGVEGSDVTLECASHGDPTPELTFIRPEHPSIVYSPGSGVST